MKKSRKNSLRKTKIKKKIKKLKKDKNSIISSRKNWNKIIKKSIQKCKIKTNRRLLRRITLDLVQFLIIKFPLAAYF